MGSWFAHGLPEKGFVVTLYNRRTANVQKRIDKGATFKSTPTPIDRDSVKNINFVISRLTNDQASKSVWLDKKVGAIHRLGKDSVAIESSTVSDSWITELACNLNFNRLNFWTRPWLAHIHKQTRDY